MGNTYRYFQDPCALCGESFPTREMTKLYLGESHSSCPTPRKLCCVCDNCLPKLFYFLAVSEPEKKERSYKRRRYCRKCYHDVGKTALYCSHCGSELELQKEDDYV